MRILFYFPIFLAEDFRAVVERENSVQGDASNSGGDRKRKRKSRWASSNDGNEKTFIPGMPTILPSNLNPDQQEAYLGSYQFAYSLISLLHNLPTYLYLIISPLIITNLLYFILINDSPLRKQIESKVFKKRDIVSL